MSDMFHKRHTQHLGVELPAPKGLRRFDRGNGVILTTVDTRGERKLILGNDPGRRVTEPYQSQFHTGPSVSCPS